MFFFFFFFFFFVFASVQPRFDQIKHLASPLARSYRYQSVREKLSKLFHSFKGYGLYRIFIFLPRLSLCQRKLNFWQVHWRYLDNISQYDVFNQTIPKGLSAMAIFATSRKHAYIILTPLNPTFIY